MRDRLQARGALSSKEKTRLTPRLQRMAGRAFVERLYPEAGRLWARDGVEELVASFGRDRTVEMIRTARRFRALNQALYERLMADARK